MANRALSPLPPFLSRLLLGAMVVFDAAFLLFVTFAAWNNRLAIDDFTYLDHFNQAGVWGGAEWFWFHWTGRFCASLVICGTSGVAVTNGGRLLLYNLATFALMISGLSFLLARVWARFFQFPLRLRDALTVGTFACALLVLGTRSMGEVWFWLSGSANYVWPLGLLCFALGLLTPSAPRPFEIAGASGLLFTAAFFNDSLAVVVLPLFAWQLWQAVRNCPAAMPLLHRVIRAPIFVPLVCMGAAWLLCLIAPGQKPRIALSGGLHFAVAPQMTLLSLLRGDGYLLLKHGHAFFLALLVGASAGMAQRSLPDLAPMTPALLTKRLRHLAAFVLAVSLLTLIPTVIAYGHAIDRVYIHITVALVAASFVLGATLVQTDAFSRVIFPRRIEAMSLVAVLTGAVALFGYSAFTLPTMTAYARAYDARFAFLQSLRITSGAASVLPGGQALSLIPLPPPGPLFPAEIQHNPNHWINTDLQKALRLPCPVRLAGKGVDPFR